MELLNSAGVPGGCRSGPAGPVFLFLFVAAIGVGCGGQLPRPPLAERGGLQVLSGYAYPTVGEAGAAYLHIRNSADLPDTLFAVQNEGQSGMLMTTEGTRMIMVVSATIAPGSEIAMRPGGMHLMFEGLSRPVAVGDTVRLSLRFARAGELGVLVPVVAYGEMP